MTQNEPTHEVRRAIPKIIFVSGGVMSGVGKGVAAASIAKILQENGFSVNVVKIDPYINYDAGTLRPTEHGEVWVTDDGGEIDQDLGNYERFLGSDIPKKNNITTGQIYKEIIDRERRGEYLGQTVEYIPHVIDEIKRRIRDCANGFDILIVEIGGTVGEYQNMPYFFAAKSFELELGWENVCHVLVTYLPVPSNIGEMKTKPTQQAIKMLNENGIFPDFILCRAATPVDDVRKRKIQMSTNIGIGNIISAPDIRTIYSAPLKFEEENMGEKILHRLRLKAAKEPDWTRWKKLVENIESPSDRIKIAIVGKYVDTGAFTLADSYISVNHALEHAGASLGVGVEIGWVDSKQIEKSGVSVLKDYNGIIVPVGFGATGVEGKIAAIKHAREHDKPFLGLCFGMQLAVVEYARSIGLKDANSVEVDPKTPHPVIDIQPAQKEILANNLYGGTMRLGAYAASLKKSIVLSLYEKTGRLARDKEKLEQLKKNESQKFRVGVLDEKAAVLERHRHRYEVNPNYVQVLSDNGLFFSGHHTRFDGTKLMEFIELPKHKFFVATQSHPEFKSRLGDPSPLFFGFVDAARK